MENGLSPSALGIVLAAGTTVRLVAGPFGGRLADKVGPASVLTVLTALAAVIALGYAPARGLPLLLLVSVAHAAVLAPLTPITDALALGSAGSKPGFQYGWVRAAGSAAFIVGAIASGAVVDRDGLGVIIWLNAGLLLAAAACSRLVPNKVAGPVLLPMASPAPVSALGLLRIAPFRRLMFVAALIGGSHALHDGFEVIRWRQAGLSAGESSLLWNISVAAEFAVFLFFGRRWLDRLGPGRAMMLAAAAGMVRWGAVACTAWFPVMALVEPLHGLTFALLHLACMDMIGRVIPRQFAATAQAFYANVAMGVGSAAVTLAAGPLYGEFGAGSFWAMVLMCGVALPLARNIHVPGREQV